MYTKLKNVLYSTSQLLKEGAGESLRSRSFQARDALVFLTYRCTSRCVGCNMWQRCEEPGDELSWDEWQPILADLADSGIRKVELFGGDALLRKELLIETVRFCRKHDIYTFFPTNSLGLTEKTARDLVEAGLNHVYLSLDELPEFDGAIRGIKRHSDKVLRAFEWLRAARGDGRFPRLDFITTVSASNWRSLPALLALSSERGADAHHLWAMSEFTKKAVSASPVNGVVPNPYFMSSDGTSHRLSRADAAELWQMLREIRANSDQYAPMDVKMETMEHLDPAALASLEFPRQKCVSCTNVVVLSPYGDVMPCPYYGNYALGNLRDVSLAQTWGNVAHRDFARLQQRHELPICDHCSLKFVHRPFSAVVRNEARRVRERLL
ncbi:radical SAM protein [Lentisalinibacter sediminis]|uniref:radical SAM protein n=1 Tax=Lentisalinibacter sediminis TaxID=2992237 RepID=UPI003864953F